MGNKRLRGIPILHDEVKKMRGIRITDTAYETMREAAQAEGISLSELIERWARSIHIAKT